MQVQRSCPSTLIPYLIVETASLCSNARKHLYLVLELFCKTSSWTVLAIFSLLSKSGAKIEILPLLLPKMWSFTLVTVHGK